MPRSRSRRLLALVTAAAVLATMSAATVASPASAAKPKCAGKTATIVGTGKGEVIRGTARRDIIVARGGNDRIYGRGGNDIICAGGGNDIVYGGPGADRIFGQLGRDRLLGNAGPDFLAGQIGNDTLNGGTGVDTCFQGTGSGLVANCERPSPPAPPAAPTPPPPAGPQLIDLDANAILAVAYSDIDGLDGYSTGDVLIAKLVDANGDDVPSVNDTIEMGRYPTNLAASGFGGFAVSSHVVVVNGVIDGTRVQIGSGLEDAHEWVVDGALCGGDPCEFYRESEPGYASVWMDRTAGSLATEGLDVQLDSPSRPQTAVLTTRPDSTGDDGFIDVVLNYPVP